METTINITLPEDFNILCNIYQIRPETIIQKFIEQVSFPVFYSNTNGEERWATFFFLNYLNLYESDYKVNEVLENHYLKAFTKVTAENLDMHPHDTAKAEQAGREVMQLWLKAVLTERAKYIIDNL